MEAPRDLVSRRSPPPRTSRPRIDARREGIFDGQQTRKGRVLPTGRPAPWSAVQAVTQAQVVLVSFVTLRFSAVALPPPENTATLSSPAGGNTSELSTTLPSPAKTSTPDPST